MCRVNVKIREGYQVPEYKTAGSVGMDIQAVLNGRSGIRIPAGGSVVVDTPIAIELPEGMEAQVRPRSGLAFNNDVVCVLGTGDSDFRGFYKVKLFNLGYQDYVVKDGERVAQIVFNEVIKPCLHVVDELSETERGSGGFGHTGKH